MAKYNVKFVFEPTYEGMTILGYESNAKTKEDLIKEIIHYTTIQTFEVENA
jgi:hypothetical protein